MRYIAIFIVICCLAACCGRAPLEAVGDNITEDTSHRERELIQDSIYMQWCELNDSMAARSRSLVSNELLCLLDKGCQLNKEQEVFRCLSSLCGIGDTVLFVENMNTFTQKVFFSFWNKRHGNVYETSNLYSYRYMKYPQKSLHNLIKPKMIDTILIRNNPELHDLSKELIQTCNDWDTLQLKTNRNLDGVSGETRHTLVYRIVLLRDKRFDIDCVKLARQGHPGDEVTNPYEVVPDEKKN